MKYKILDRAPQNYSQVIPTLSDVEIAIIRLITEGKGTKEIAESLRMTCNAVTCNLSAIVDKFEVYGNGKQMISTQTNQQKKSSQPKIIVAIPCFNEENYIHNIVREVKQYADQVAVVDDGSRDGTSETAIDAGALVLRHEYNRGAGAATRSCFNIARICDADILITIDGDNQHSPKDIPVLLDPILKEQAELIIGSRFIKSNKNINAPRYRNLGINIITRLFNICSRMSISDSQSCFRAYSRNLVDNVHITEDGFGFSIEILMQANKKGFRMEEVPISCLYHSQGSTLNPVQHGIGVTFATLKIYFKSLKIGSKRIEDRDNSNKSLV